VVRIFSFQRRAIDSGSGKTRVVIPVSEIYLSGEFDVLVLLGGSGGLSVGGDIAPNWWTSHNYGSI
jgi:hypothetical protein